MPNTYTPDQAIAIGLLGKQIKDRQDKIAQIQDMIAAGHWQISRLAAVDRNSNEIQLILGLLDAESSAAALQYALSVYQTQLTALQTELAAI